MSHSTIKQLWSNYLVVFLPCNSLRLTDYTGENIPISLPQKILQLIIIARHINKRRTELTRGMRSHIPMTDHDRSANVPTFLDTNGLGKGGMWQSRLAIVKWKEECRRYRSGFRALGGIEVLLRYSVSHVQIQSWSLKQSEKQCDTPRHEFVSYIWLEFVRSSPNMSFVEKQCRDILIASNKTRILIGIQTEHVIFANTSPSRCHIGTFPYKASTTSHNATRTNNSPHRGTIS